MTLVLTNLQRICKDFNEHADLAKLNEFAGRNKAKHDRDAKSIQTSGGLTLSLDPLEGDMAWIAWLSSRL